MIKMEVINEDRQQFLVAANEPMRVEVLVTEDGKVIAHVYTGAEVDMDQKPIGAFDGTVPSDDGDGGWIYEARCLPPKVYSLPPRV
jgi:hypothetical protein